MLYWRSGGNRETGTGSCLFHRIMSCMSPCSYSSSQRPGFLSGPHNYKALLRDFCHGYAHCLPSHAQSLYEFPDLIGLLSSYFSVPMFPPWQRVPWPPLWSGLCFSSLIITPCHSVLKTALTSWSDLAIIFICLFIDCLPVWFTSWSPIPRTRSAQSGCFLSVCQMIGLS